MNAIEAIRAELVADSTVRYYIGSDVFPVKAPQTAQPPFVVLTEVSDVPTNTLADDVASRLREVRLQVDVYAESYLEGRKLADAVDNVIANLGRHDLSAWRLIARDLYEDETELHRRTMDFTVWL